jgi:hypothetical protein
VNGCLLGLVGSLLRFSECCFSSLSLWYSCAVSTRRKDGWGFLSIYIGFDDLGCSDEMELVGGEALALSLSCLLTKGYI